MSNIETKRSNKDSIVANKDSYKAFYWYQKAAENGILKHKMILHHYIITEKEQKRI